MECFDVGKGLDLLGSEVIHDIVMIVHHHREGLAKDQRDPDKDIAKPRTEAGLDKLGDGEERCLDQHPQEAPDLEQPQGHGDEVLVEEGGGEEHDEGGRGAGGAGGDQGLVQVPYTPSSGINRNYSEREGLSIDTCELGGSKVSRI